MRRSLLALAALTAVLLTACTQWDAQEPVIGIVDTDHEESTEPTEKNSENSVTNPPATPSKEMEETMSRVSVRVQTEQYDATDDDGALLCTVRLSVPTVTVEGRDAAQSAIQAVLDQMADQRRTEAEQVTELARTDRPAMEQYTTFQGYGVTDSLDLGRLDSRTINLLWTTSDNTGGAHGNTMTTAFVFDAETGERLSLLDVAINTDALSMQLEEQVLQQMEQAPEQYFPEAQQWVPQLLEDGFWYFSEDGVVLLSNPGVLAPYGAGTLEFTATYEALTGLLDERWIPDPAADSQGEPQIALTADDGAPAPMETVQADTSGAEMVLWTDGVLEDFRIWRVTSSDGVTWYRGGCCYAADRLEDGQAVGLTAMLPDVMTNVMISYTVDGETVYRGIGESGKDGSVFFLELDTVID